MTIGDLDAATVASLRASLDAGELTSRAIIEAHLARIERYDSFFGAIRCLAPDALTQADESDRVRRESGPRSAIDGLPVLVKDNIDVAGLPTTAGALALADNIPTADAPVVAALRAAGAVILGKTNLSEMANFLTEDMPSGYSSLGGQVLNPYDLALTPSGSSSGSATAAALAFAPLAVGTETDGSITSPCDHQSLVGMKPTLGRLSRTGIVPIAPSQDTPGPMTRTVADAAALLAAMVGADPSDAATVDAPPLGPISLMAGALAGVRVGVVRPELPEGAPPVADAEIACYEAALAALAAAGAVLVDVSLGSDAKDDDELAVLHYEYAPSVAGYLTAVGAPLRSLADLQAWNAAHADVALKFGQVHVDKAVAIDHAAERATYEATRARDLAVTTGALTAAIEDMEVLVFPGASGCSYSARAGWPSIILPAGYRSDNRRPFGVMMVGRPWTEARLFALAFAAEQALPPRRRPADINPAVFRRLG